MNAFLSSFSGLTSGLLKVSAQASLLIVLVLLVQWLGAKKLPPRVRYALWLLVVARLLLPVSLQSGFSVFNFTTATPAKFFHAVGAASKTSAAKAEVKNPPAPTAPVSPTPAPIVAAPSSAGVPPAPGAKAGEAPALPTPSPAQVFRDASPGIAKSFPWAPALSFIWLAGVLFLLARIIWIPLRLNAQLARHETATPPAVFEILEESKRLSGVNQVLPIVQSRAVESPALLGFIRPWLLLPDGLVEKFTPQELRFVFLHELAHLKRRDIAVNWLATLLQILHWPNPLVWFAFARMRADRELACDELALSFARAEDSQPYGHAIIKLIEGFRPPAVLPGLVGILEDQTQMKKRITMIAQFKKMTQWSAAAAGLFLVLGLVTLTDAQTDKSTTKQITPLAGSTVRTVISSADDEAFGTLSPDETAIAYVAWGAKGGALMVKELRMGETRTLVAVPESKDYAYAEVLLWSPDSKSIAYSWFDAGSSGSLRIISRDGGAPKIVKKEGEEQIYAYDWSRDGKVLVGLMVKPPNSDSSPLAALSIATGEIITLVKNGGRHQRFSPDGKFVVYERDTDGNPDVFVTSIDGKRTTPIMDSPAAERAPIFSADGRYVLFNSNRSGAWALWAVAVESGQPSGDAFPVKYDFGDYNKTITAAGNLAFFTTGKGNGRGGSNDVFLINATDRAEVTTGKPVLNTQSGFGRNYSPEWSRDGKKIAFLRFIDGFGQPYLCVQGLDGSREETFELPKGLWGRVFWAPDGKSLALSGRMKSGTGLFHFSLETRKMASAPFSADFPIGYTRDGKEFIVMNVKGEKRMAINPETKAERMIAFSAEEMENFLQSIKAGQLHGYHVSLDESMVAWSVTKGKESKLLVADTNFQTQRVIAHAIDPAIILAPRWSPDGTKVAYFVAPNGENWLKELRVSAADGSWDAVVNTGPRVIGGWGNTPATWSADSTKLAVALRETRVCQLSVLSNYLPPEKLVAK